MPTTAWPFVITRNHKLDYRPLVAPRFVDSKGLSSTLHREVRTGRDHPWPPTDRRVDHEQLGELTLVFHSVEATRRLIGGRNDDQLKDRFGRPIFVIEGYAIEGNVADPDAAKRELPKIHQLTAAAFRPFWESDEKRFPAELSDEVQLGSGVAAATAPADRRGRVQRALTALSRPQRWLPVRWRHVVLAGLFGTACVGAAVAVILRTRRC